MLEPTNTMLVCIDMQGNLAQAMHRKEDLFKNVRILLAGLRILEIPLMVTEQNPQRLGPTIPEVAGLVPDLTPISKMCFSCCDTAAFMTALERVNRRHILLAGIEAHVCIYQTAADLIARGYTVEVVVDCISSRTAENKAIALEKLKAAGAQITSAETVLFELLKTAESPKFREIVKIVK